MTIVTWSLFGLLMLGIFFGVLWGAIRGFKRSAFRLVTFLFAIPLAVLLAPVIANPFGGIRFGGYTMSEHLLNAMGGEAADAAANFTQLDAFISALPIAIISLLVFVALLYIFRFITWIVYAIFAGKVAPKNVKSNTGDRTANGMAKFEMRPTKRHRWLGALVGLGQGLLIFFLVMIPVNGILTMAGSVTRYEPSFTEATAQIEDHAVLEFVHDFDNQLQRSPYGIMTRFTGMQWASGPMFDYITRVRTPRGMPNINLRQDVIRGMHLYKDFAVISQQFEDEDFADVLASPEFEPYWEALPGIVERVFEISLVQLLMSAMDDFATFIADSDLLEEYALPVSTEAILQDLRNLTAQTVLNDILNIIGIAQDIFTNGTWQDITGIVDAENALDAIADLNDTTIDTLGGILNTVTNTLGFRMSIRTFIAELLEEAVLEADVMGPSTPQVVENLVNNLKDPEHNTFDWTADLRAIRASIRIVAYFQNAEGLEDIIYIIFDTGGELISALLESEVIGPLVLEQIEDLLDELELTYALGTIPGVYLPDAPGVAVTVKVLRDILLGVTTP